MHFWTQVKKQMQLSSIYPMLIVVHKFCRRRKLHQFSKLQYRILNYYPVMFEPKSKPFFYFWFHSLDFLYWVKVVHKKLKQIIQK